ncbi:MAG: hypothetical protein DGJ47_000193, partial [Rickettsiaceae bacterium]
KRTAFIENNGFEAMRNIPAQFKNFDKLIATKDLSNMNLSFADFSDKVMQEINFDNTILIGANFKGSDCKNCSFKGADLSNSEFDEVKK